MEEIESFERESKSPSKKVDCDNYESGSETNDEFDEIIRRRTERRKRILLRSGWVDTCYHAGQGQG